MPLKQGKKIKHPSPLHLSALMAAYFRNTLIKTPEGLSYLLILLCVVQGHGHLFQSVVGLPVLHVYIPIPYPIAFSFSDDRRMWMLFITWAHFILVRFFFFFFFGLFPWSVSFAGFLFSLHFFYNSSTLYKLYTQLF